MGSKRQLIRVGGQPAYIRRDSRGRFTEVDMVNRSLPADVRQRAKRTVSSGHGDKGDQRRRK